MLNTYCNCDCHKVMGSINSPICHCQCNQKWNLGIPLITSKIDKPEIKVIEKKPYKCPVCDGTGNVIVESLHQTKLCHPCKGAGVLWQ